MAQYPASLSVADLNGRNGVRLVGDVGVCVSNAGDVNGDGFSDIVLGQPGSPFVSVVFARPGGFPAAVPVEALDGRNGFTVDVTGLGYGARSVSAAGDVNGDGFADLIAGLDGSHQAAVVFGRAGGFPATLAAASLDGRNGFRILAPGDDEGDLVVSNAGDVNGDGFADLIVGTPAAEVGADETGAAYVVYGRAPGGFGRTFDLDNINGRNGFALVGPPGSDSGASVSWAGDVNGDGFADVIVGAGEVNSAYVVFGRGGGLAPQRNLDALNGRNGFAIDVGNAYGTDSVSAAGDVNGDGFDDLLVGAGDAAPGGVATGAAYVVFGRAGGFRETIALDSLDGRTGFRIAGGDDGGDFGASASAAGDVNRDGLADLVIGAPNAGDDGEAYILFGRRPDAPVARTGTDAGQTLAGGSFGDTLTGLGGRDLLFGNGGNDTLKGGAGLDLLRGGAGRDTFVFDAPLAPSHRDRIADFRAADDTIRLDDRVFKALDPGRLTPAEFKDVGRPGARVDANDRIVYDSDTGSLSYDANGSAAGGRVTFAVLDNQAALGHADFLIV